MTSFRHTSFGAAAVLSWSTLGLLGAISESMPPHFVLMSCFAIAAVISTYHLAYLEAFLHADAIPVSLINYLWPACLILLGNLFFGLKSGCAGYVGVVLGFCAIVVLVDGDSIQAQSSQMIGYGLALAGAVLWALFSNLRRHNSREPIGDMTATCLLSTLFCGTSWMVSGAVLPDLNLMDSCVIIALGLGPAGGAFYLWDLGMRGGNVVLLGVLGYSVPVISTFMMLAFGIGTFNWNIISAMLLITVGGFIVQFANRLSRSRPPDRLSVG